MKKQIFRILLFILSFTGNQYLRAQNAPTIALDKSFGGSGNDQLALILDAPDGGYLLGGSSMSGLSGDKSQPLRGSQDFWVVKTDAKGNKLWDKSYGGQGVDQMSFMDRTIDGGYILGGSTNSGISGDVSQGNFGNTDYWILKIDANGNKVWDRTFTGNASDILYRIKQTTDGGFILGGMSHSTNGGDKSQPSFGLGDFWVIKLNSSGTKIWDKTFGGSSYDDLWDMQQTSDGGYILGGTTSSGISGNKTQPNKGAADLWIVKLDPNGNMLWDKEFGGIQNDYLNRIIQTTDGGYLLGGTSESNISGDKTAPNKGVSDFWLIKTDAAGNKLWDKSFGGNSGEFLFGIHQASNGGYMVCGSSTSGVSSDKTEAQIGGSDFWLVKIDDLGIKEWDKTIGGSNNDTPLFLKENLDGSFFTGGESSSGISGNKTQPNKGASDYWFVKLNAPCKNLTATISPECIIGGTNLNLSVKAIQNNGGKYSWTLQYTENGISKTITDSVAAINLAYNPAAGTRFTLVSITSGTCTTALNQTFIMPAFPDYPVAKNVSRCGPGTVTLTASGAPAGSKYVWYSVPTGGVSLQTDSIGKFTTPELKEPALYYVAAQNKLGCEGPRTQVLVSLNYCPPVYIPNIITQNHDGKNDTFQPQNLSEGNWSLQIFNRWGKKVYEKANYQNTWPEEKVKAGTYYYLLRNSDTKEQFKGWVELVK